MQSQQCVVEIEISWEKFNFVSNLKRYIDSQDGVRRIREVIRNQCKTSPPPHLIYRQLINHHNDLRLENVCFNRQFEVVLVFASRSSAGTRSLLFVNELARCLGCFCTRAGWFKHSEPHRTYTILTNTELARCVGCFCTRAGWFKHSEPPRNDTNHTIKELARCVGCLGTRSGWFKHSEPTRTTQSQS